MNLLDTQVEQSTLIPIKKSYALFPPTIPSNLGGAKLINCSKLFYSNKDIVAQEKIDRAINRGGAMEGTKDELRV